MPICLPKRFSAEETLNLKVTVQCSVERVWIPDIRSVFFRIFILFIWLAIEEKPLVVAFDESLLSDNLIQIKELESQFTFK